MNISITTKELEDLLRILDKRGATEVEKILRELQAEGKLKSEIAEE